MRRVITPFLSVCFDSKTTTSQPNGPFTSAQEPMKGSNERMGTVKSLNSGRDARANREDT